MVGAGVCVNAALQVAITWFSDLIKPPPVLRLSPSVFVLSCGRTCDGAKILLNTRVWQPLQIQCASWVSSLRQMDRAPGLLYEQGKELLGMKRMAGPECPRAHPPCAHLLFLT